jgi:hypothetical protein
LIRRLKNNTGFHLQEFTSNQRSILPYKHFVEHFVNTSKAAGALGHDAQHLGMMHSRKTKTKAAVNEKPCMKSLGVRPQTGDQNLDEAKQKTGGSGGKWKQCRPAARLWLAAGNGGSTAGEA